MKLIDELKRIDGFASEGPWEVYEFCGELSTGDADFDFTEEDAELVNYVRNNLLKIIALLEAGDWAASNLDRYTRDVSDYRESSAALAAYKLASKEAGE